MWTAFYSLKERLQTKNRRSRNKCQRSGTIHEDFRDQGRRKVKKWWRKWKERKKKCKLREIEGERGRGNRLPDDNFCLLSSPRRLKNGVKMRNVSNEFWRWRKGQRVTSVWDIWSEETLIYSLISAPTRMTRIDSFSASLLNPSGIQCICKYAGRFRVKWEKGR